MEAERKAPRRGRQPKQVGGPSKPRGRPKKVRVVPDVVEGLTAGHEVQQVALQDIDLLDKTWRFRVSMRVKDLQESILKHGQQMPVILRRLPDRQQLQIISGFRRITAIDAIGWPTVHAIVLDVVSDEAAFRLSVLENEKRKTYSDLDRAYAITKYKEMGYTVTAIAEELFGLSRKQVERLTTLTHLPDFMQDAIEDESLSATTALVLKQLHDNAPNGAIDLAAWTAKAVDEDLSVRDLRSAVLASISANASRPSLFSTRQDAKAGTVLRFKPVKVSLDTLTDDARAALVGDLEALLARVRAG